MNRTEVLAEGELTWRRSLPPGARWQAWAAPDGWPIRTVHWPASPGRPAILFANGRADFIEKYSESYWRWQARGYGVMTFDWRGQGLSGRFGSTDDGYFEKWLGDLTGLAAHAEGLFGRPLVIAGHSMGAHLALRHLARHHGPSRFSRAILFAPMAGIGQHAFGQALLYWAARARMGFGRGGAYPPSQGPYGELQRSVARQVLLTGDAARFADEAWWIGRTPELALGGATWRWIAEATASCRALAGVGIPEAVNVPVDMFMGSGERLVDAGAARAIAARLPRCTWREVAGGAHELLRERSPLQESLHADVDAIIGSAA